jgi:uncharacterized protein (TIGR00730 family)
METMLLTRQELHASETKRVTQISKEFSAGFRFLEKYPRSVTFFGSARFTEDNEYYKKARSLAGKIVNELNYSIVTGGGPGIMEAANRGAYENGGQSVGLTIELPHEQVSNGYMTDSLDFYYFFSRKVCLSFSAEAYIYFPGGCGTLDEFFEILTLVQTKKLSPIPIFLVGVEYWEKVIELMKTQMLEGGMIDPEDFDLFTITEDENEIVRIIKNAPIHNGLKFEKLNNNAVMND